MYGGRRGVGSLAYHESAYLFVWVMNGRGRVSGNELRGVEAVHGACRVVTGHAGFLTERLNGFKVQVGKVGAVRCADAAYALASAYELAGAYRAFLQVGVKGLNDVSAARQAVADDDHVTPIRGGATAVQHEATGRCAYGLSLIRVFSAYAVEVLPGVEAAAAVVLFSEALGVIHHGHIGGANGPLEAIRQGDAYHLARGELDEAGHNGGGHAAERFRSRETTFSGLFSAAGGS